MTILSEKNPFYEFSQMEGGVNIEKYKDKITTFYVVEGKLEIDIDNAKLEINSTEGLLVSSNSIIKNIKKNPNTIAFEVLSKKKITELIEFIDKENTIEEENITNFKILKNHKKVVKPWGYELWIVWLKNYHVLKKIYMKKDFKCSLQFHEKKYETNHLTFGKAKVLKNFHIDPKSTEEQARKKIENIDLIKDYSQNISAPYSFTNVPGEIHRVFSLEDYTAYEVSTPELDDVVRITDDNSRKSGRITLEHKS
jgi:mannose-6-phosphate isomerase